MKKVLAKILKDACIIFVIISIFMMIAVYVEAIRERQAIEKNDSVVNLPFKETIDEQISKYENTGKPVSTNTYSELLTTMTFITTIIPLTALYSSVVMAIVFNLGFAIFDKVSVNKLNEQLQKHN